MTSISSESDRPRVLLLPGTGSDEVFVADSCARPLAQAGFELVAVAPSPGRGLVADAFTELDRRADATEIVVGGISLGAHVATQWAMANQHRCSAVLAIMPGWCGQPGDAPAAMSARAGAELVESIGTQAALQLATEGVADWLSRELRRAWPRYGDALAASFRASAESVAPTESELASLRVPTVVLGCDGDPVHPVSVARRWARALPHSHYTHCRLEDLQTDLETVGRTIVRGWAQLDPARVPATHDSIGASEFDDQSSSK